MKISHRHVAVAHALQSTKPSATFYELTGLVILDIWTANELNSGNSRFDRQQTYMYYWKCTWKS